MLSWAYTYISAKNFPQSKIYEVPKDFNRSLLTQKGQAILLQVWTHTLVYVRVTHDSPLSLLSFLTITIIILHYSHHSTSPPPLATSTTNRSPQSSVSSSIARVIKMDQRTQEHNAYQGRPKFFHHPERSPPWFIPLARWMGWRSFTTHLT